MMIWIIWIGPTNIIKKKNKEREAKRKAEKRERNKYWMEVITFLLMVVSVLYSCLASTIKQVWQWLLMLLKLQ